MAKFTRKELKKDPFLSVYYDDFVEFAQNHYQSVILVAAAVAVIILAGISWRRHRAGQDLTASTLLGEALATYRADVGQPSQAGSQATQAPAFPDASAKYQAAIKQFRTIWQKYPSRKAGQIALYHVGLCEAQLGNSGAAISVLRQAGQFADKDIASLAQFSLADELARSGKPAEARSIFTNLAEHPTDAVPAATAWLALAGIERESNPAQARKVYQRVIKDFGSDSDLAGAVQEQMASLPAH
ncbi:MAG: tetratricopeptide repeat protein [Terriglobia bacterium]